MTSAVSHFLDKMAIFTAGHDRGFRPIIYINISQIKNSEVDDFKQCVSFFSLAIKKRMLRPYHIENWVLMIDLNDRSMLNLPIKALRGLIETTSVTFAGTLHRLNFLNPSFTFYGVWKIISNFLHEATLEKIHVIKHGKTSELLKQIAPDQLLAKYGGTLPMPPKAFPLVGTFQPNEQPEVLTTEQTFIPPIVKQKSLENLRPASVKPVVARRNIFAQADFDSDVH